MNRRSFVRSLGAAAATVELSSPAQTSDPVAKIVTVPPNYAGIHYYGFANVRVSSREASSDRFLPDSAHRSDNPAARIYFESNASEVSIIVNFASMDAMTGRTQADIVSDWVLIIDEGESIRFSRARAFGGPQIARVRVNQMWRRTYDIVLPYADNMTFMGLALPKGAEMFPIKRKPKRRYVAYGDSITQGFRAALPTETYPWRIARLKKEWEAVNMGFGGRQATAGDGAAIGRLKPDVLTVLIGVNDCLQRKPLDRFTADIRGFLAEFRRQSPRTPLYLITPLPVADIAKWPGSDKLPEYRAAMAAVASSSNDPALKLVDGTTLIEANPSFFSDGLHPNPEGFRIISERLAAKLPEA